MGNNSRQGRAIQQVLWKMNITFVILWKLSVAYHMLKRSLGLPWFDALKVALGMGKPRQLVAEKPSKSF